MGSSSAQYAVTGRWVRSKKFTYASTGTSVAVLDIPAGTFIPSFGVYVYVSTVWAGGTPSIDVGDSDTDGWVDTTNVTETTAGMYGGTASAATYNDSGKLYTSADTLDVTLAASSTAGEGYVYAYLVDVSDIYDD